MGIDISGRHHRRDCKMFGGLDQLLSKVNIKISCQLLILFCGRLRLENSCILRFY